MIVEGLKLFKRIKYDEFINNGCDGVSSLKKYVVNPYSNSFLEEVEPFHVSYSYVANDKLEYCLYEKYELVYRLFFEELFSLYEIIGVKLNRDTSTFIHYHNFLIFKNDLEKALREDTSLNFIIDSLGIVLNCNYDLSIVLYSYFSNAQKMEDLLLLFKKHKLYVSEELKT